VDIDRELERIQGFERAMLTEALDALKVADQIKERLMRSPLRILELIAERLEGKKFCLKAIALYKEILKHAPPPQRPDIVERIGDLYASLGFNSRATAAYTMDSSHQDDEEIFDRLRQKIRKLEGCGDQEEEAVEEP